MSLPLLFIILTVISSLISSLFIQEKSDSQQPKHLVKPLTKAGWISFAITVVIGALSILCSIQDQRKADAAYAELNQIKSQANEIHANTKRLEYPLPSEIEVSFDLDYKLKPETFQKFNTAIAKRKICFVDPVPGRGYLLPNELLKEIMNWEKYCSIVSLHFSNNYQSWSAVEPIASFTNVELISRHYNDKEYLVDLSWNYFPLEKKFSLYFHHLKLELNKDLLAVAHNNYRVKSVIHLKGSTLLINVACVQRMDSTELNSLKINSNEFNLIKRKLEKAYNNDLFLTRDLDL